MTRQSKLWWACSASAHIRLRSSHTSCCATSSPSRFRICPDSHISEMSASHTMPARHHFGYTPSALDARLLSLPLHADSTALSVRAARRKYADISRHAAFGWLCWAVRERFLRIVAENMMRHALRLRARCRHANSTFRPFSRLAWRLLMLFVAGRRYCRDLPQRAWLTVSIRHYLFRIDDSFISAAFRFREEKRCRFLFH